MSKYEILAIVVIFIIIIACAIGGWYLLRAIIESDLPDWVKLYFITR